MGPPSEKGGISVAMETTAGALYRLQWGRPPRRAESRASCVCTAMVGAASMGPPSEKGGIMWTGFIRSLDSNGFNGAALREGRNHGGHCHVLPPAPASMGPPSEKGGIPSCPRIQRPQLGFNGAALREGRNPEDVAEATGASMGFNGAALREGRNRCAAGAVWFRPSSFNGAALREGRNPSSSPCCAS